MSAFSADFSCLTQMSRDIQRMGENVKKNEAAVVKLAANEYKNDVQPRLPYKTHTLARSVHVEVQQDGIRMVALVGTDVIYAKQREYGGIITAKNKEFLHWIDYEGKEHFAKSVYQPPRPVWRSTFDTNLPKYERMVKGAFDRAMWNQDIETALSVRPDLLGGLVIP